jgi:hypothetical protein
MFVGAAKVMLGRHEEAVDWLRRSIEANRNNLPSYGLLAAALALPIRGRAGRIRM